MDDEKSLSYSICAKVSQTGDIWKTQGRGGKILRELSERKGVEFIEAEYCPNHIHMLVAIPPHMSLAQCMGYLKRKSSLMIFDRHTNLKYKYNNWHFGCRGYYDGLLQTQMR